MFRILIKQTDFGTAAHVAGVEAHHTFKTFDVELPEVEQYLARTMIAFCRGDSERSLA